MFCHRPIPMGSLWLELWKRQSKNKSLCFKISNNFQKIPPFCIIYNSKPWFNFFTDVLQVCLNWSIKFILTTLLNHFSDYYNRWSFFWRIWQWFPKLVVKVTNPLFMGEHEVSCISSASERKHEIACTSWSSCLWKLCELVSNIEVQLCIVYMYTGNLSIISTISQFESDSKMCTFHLIWSPFVYDVWTTDLGFCQVSLLTHFPWQS